MEQEFARSGSAWRPDRQAGRLDEDDKDKDEETLKADYRAIAERRVRLGLLLAEIGRANSITVGEDEMTRAMRTEAMRYPGQEQQMFEFFRQNPRAAEPCAGRCSRRRWSTSSWSWPRSTEKTVTPEELVERAGGRRRPPSPPAIKAAAGAKAPRPLAVQALAGLRVPGAFGLAKSHLGSGWLDGSQLRSTVHLIDWVAT